MKKVKLFLFIAIFVLGLLIFSKEALAVDSNCVSAGSGNWTTITWTNCTGNPGGDPDSDDTVTIADGHAVTLDTSTSIANLVLCDTTCDNSTSLTHSGTNSLTISGTVTVNGGAGPGDSVNWDIAGGTGTVTGSISYNPQATQGGRDARITISTGTLNADGGIAFENTANSEDNQILAITSTGTVNLKGSITNQTVADIQPGTASTFTYNDSAAQTIVFDSTAATYFNLTILNTNASGATLGAAISTTNTTGDVTVGNDSCTCLFRNGGFAITGTSTRTFLVNNSGEFQMSGTSTYPTGFSTFTYDSNSTVSYLQTNGPTITNATYGNLRLIPASATELVLPATLSDIAGNVTVGDSTNAGATGATNNPSFAVAGTFTIAANATYTTGTGTLTLSASGTPLTITGTFTATSGGTVNYTGTTATTVTATTYSNLGVGTNANATATTFTLGGNTTVSGVLTVGNAASSANDTLDASTTTLTLSGTGGDPFVLTAWGVFTASTSTVDYTGNNTGGDTTVQTATYNNLRLGGSSAENYNPEGAITVSTTLTMNANGTLIGTQNVTVNGGVTGSGTINLTGGTFEQLVGAAQNFGTTSGSNNWTFNNLKFNNSSGVARTITVATGGTGEIIVSATLTLGDSGTATITLDNDTNDRILNVDGSVTISTQGILTASSASSFTIGTNFTNNGTFNASGGTVTLDTTTTAILDGSGSPAITFNAFTSTTAGKTIQFTAGKTFRINGLFTVTGAQSNQIHIHSTTSSQWFINHQGTEDVTYAHIDNSGCDAASTDVTLNSTSTDGGNNDSSCWIFPVAIQIELRGGVELRGGTQLGQ